MKKELPRTKKAWSKEVAAAGIQGLTIHNFPLRSASKMELAQYLLLRVLWREHNASDLDTHRYGLSDFLEQAKERLQHYNGWKEYYKHVHLPDQETIPDLMTFSTPRFLPVINKKVYKGRCQEYHWQRRCHFLSYPDTWTEETSRTSSESN